MEFGFAARAFSSPKEFIASDCVGQTKMSDPRHRHAENERPRPSVGIKASRVENSDRLHHRQHRQDCASATLARGAVECLFKPFSDTALLEALSATLQVLIRHFEAKR
jgi:hypothetical protein